MKIATWNVNSIKARIEHLLLWLTEEKPDIVLLQELKCMNEAFPSEQLEELGYNIALHGQKTYNGVAILSKMPLSDVVTNFPNNPIPEEARYIEAFVNLPQVAIRVASVYVPNGQDLGADKYQIKLKFLDALAEYYQSLMKDEEMLVVGGDFNVAIADADVYNPALLNESICFSNAERRMLRKFIATGFIDAYRMMNDNMEGFTWWDYRAGAFNQNNGMRIDYLFCSPEVAHLSQDCYVLKILRAAERPSDHIPVTLLLNDASLYKTPQNLVQTL